MRCPFLREAQVKYCKASAVKRMIVRMPSEAVDERCSTREYENCPSLLQLHEDHPSHSHCPFLHESLVQYCAASPVTKYIPHSESSIIRCGNDNHHYCDLYLSVAAPDDDAADTESSRDPIVDGIRLPRRLAFTANHFWLDQADDGTCHIGIDGFFASFFQHIEKINFLTTKGIATPIVAVTVRGIDLQIVFAAPLNITGVNSYLRTDPNKLLTHPYSSGWLFEGTLPEAHNGNAKEYFSLELLRGDEATHWMRKEVAYLSDFLHNSILPNRTAVQPLMADGGVAAADFANHLEHRELLHLFNEFFSPFANWRNASC
jgi:glycine cleavage system H lipoate-binding protein